MAIDLIHLARDITDEEFAKVILSSGDFFPGFYRFTLGDRNCEPGHLSISGMLSVYFDQLATGLRYTRSDWVSYCKIRHSNLDNRNKSRSDSAVYEIIDQGYLKWMTSASQFDIALLEIDKPVKSIEQHTTYFFMGSLIRFTSDQLLMGYDMLRDTHTLAVPINFLEIKQYVENIYGENLYKLFNYANLVATLSFEKDVGTLTMSDRTVEECLLAHDNSLVIASNRDVSKHIPIRWAKDILLSEVCKL
jgi:hypothetical protein